VVAHRCLVLTQRRVIDFGLVRRKKLMTVTSSSADPVSSPAAAAAPRAAARGARAAVTAGTTGADADTRREVRR
jgi:hypothetical protein